MKKRSSGLKPLLTLTIICILLMNVLISVGLADKNSDYVKGFDKGPSYIPVVPLKKITFVNYDEQSYLDDYAYLASVPTAVFKNDSQLYSHPLLFYQDEQNFDDEKKLPLNARVGIDYFMEDWMSYCNGLLDQMTLINVPREKVDQWEVKSEKYVEIDSNDPYFIASELALLDWSYSNSAVVAVIDEENEKLDKIVSNKIKQSFPACSIKILPTIEIKQINYLNPVFEEFQVGENYRHIKADIWWDALFTRNGKMISNADPAGDPDIQLYFQENGRWIQSMASCNNLLGPRGHKYAQSHVYNHGLWKIGTIDLPTEGIIENLMPTAQGSPIKMFFSDKPTYYADITMYVGSEDIKLFDTPSFGCRNADFKLTWNNPSVTLGFSIIGPSGEAVYTIMNESSTNFQEIHLESIGECLPGEDYSISVFSIKDVKTPVEFEIEYSWKQVISKKDCDSITSASEGAVLASVLNAPLLYVSPSHLPNTTKDAMYKLGVENIHIINMGSHLSQIVLDDIKKIGKIKANYKKPKQIYEAIQQKTNENDIIFTTFDPWTYWYMGELKPAGEKKGALFVGPAAYIAAHHGSPVIIIDNHPRLSSSTIYHNELWRRFSNNRQYHSPSTAEMVFTGRRIYDFLADYGFDQIGKETIITVAGQYDIGVSWDRIFPGVANSGRFLGSPVDTGFWISRNVFYPAMIFENPAIENVVELENGSVSRRDTGFRKGSIFSPKEAGIMLNFNDYKKTRNSEIGKFEFPVLCSFITYNHRFNERASKYYGDLYSCADGLTPGIDTTQNSIDKGIMEKYSGETGCIFPDMTESEVVPFYLRKGGYDCAFSTNMSSIVKNLNEGVIMWIHSSHGSEENGGSCLFWNPEDSFKNRSNYPSASIVNFHRWIVDEWAAELPIYSKILTRFKLLGKILNGLGLSYFIPATFYGFDPIPGVFEEDNPWRSYDYRHGLGYFYKIYSEIIKYFYTFY